MDENLMMDTQGEEAQSDQREASSAPLPLEELSKEELLQVAHNFKEKADQFKNEKYRVLHEAQQREIQNQQKIQQLEDVALREMEEVELLHKSALGHYDDNLTLRLKEAKEKKVRALEEGDAVRIADADLELTQTALEIGEVERYHKEKKAQENYQRQYYQNRQENHYNQQYNAPAVPDIEPAAAQWMALNPWADPQSRFYNPQRAAQFHYKVKDLDENYMQSGRSHEIYTPQYFKEVNNLINDRGNRPTYRQGPQNTSPVRGAGTYQSGQRRPEPKYSSLEETLLKNCGATRDSWEKNRKITDKAISSRGRMSSYGQ